MEKEQFAVIKLTRKEKVLNEIANILETEEQKYSKIGLEIGALVDEKNAAYGDSFTKAAEFLTILYPNGIPVNKYTDALCIVRIFDKLMRLASNKSYNNERPYADIAGYAILGLFKDRERSNPDNVKEERSEETDLKEFLKKAESLLADSDVELDDFKNLKEISKPTQPNKFDKALVKKASLKSQINLDRLR